MSKYVKKVIQKTKIIGKTERDNSGGLVLVEW